MLVMILYKMGKKCVLKSKLIRNKKQSERGEVEFIVFPNNYLWTENKFSPPLCCGKLFTDRRYFNFIFLLFLVPSGHPSPQSTALSWYYYGVPIIVLVMLILVVGWVFYQNKRKSGHSGAYDLKFAERDEIIVD